MYQFTKTDLEQKLSEIYAIESEHKMLPPNPFGPPQDQNSLLATSHLHKRLLDDIRAVRVEDQIFQVLQSALNQALTNGDIHILMSEEAKNFLLAQMMKQVLGDMLKKLENSNSSMHS